MRRIASWVWWSFWTLWLVFTVWLLLYAMPISAGFAALGLWVSRPWRPIRPLRITMVWMLGLVVVLCAGLPEYAETTNRLHCRTLGFMGVRAAADCDEADVERGREVAKEGGALYTWRERMGVHGFNHLLGLGGVLAGLPEVALETVWMSWAADPLDNDDYGGATSAPTRVRRRQCTASQGGARSGVLADPLALPTAFPMRSAKVRKVLAKGVDRLPEREGAKKGLGEVHFSSGGSGNNAVYFGALMQDSLRVPLALEVGDSSLDVVRRADGDVDASWTGTIHYPGSNTAFSIPMPTLWGVRQLRVSETVFCGMQVDGAMNPYPLQYRWVVGADDDRLSKEGRGQSQRVGFEWLAHQVGRLFVNG